MRITMEKIRSLCTEDSFERGMKYFEEGRVNKVDFFGDTITAVVQGAQNYNVTIRMNDDIEGRCTCPYDLGGYCKHIVATLIQFSEGYEKIKSWKEREESRVDAVLNQMTVEKFKEFLSVEFEKDPKLRARFLIYFTGEGEEKSIHDYKREINQLYRDVAGRIGFIDYDRIVDFSYILDVADRYIEKQNFLEAAKICQALSEVIAENMDMVDDSSGYYSGEFECAIEKLATCLKEAKLRPEEKRPYIEYFFNKFIEGEPDYFREIYDYALREVCISEEDIGYWKNLLEPYLPESLPDDSEDWDKHYDAKEIIEMQIFILDKLNEKRNLYKLLEKHYLKDCDLCLTYAETLEKDGEITRSVDVAEEALKIFPDHRTAELRKFLNKFYEKSSPEKYRENLKNLFLLEQDWSYYDKLKEISFKEEWNSFLQEIITNLSRDERFNMVLIDVYLKEKMHEEALRTVLAAKSLDILSRYRHSLSAMSPKEYFKAYKENLIRFAASNMGRRHYKEVVEYLKKMKDIKQCEIEFKKLVGLLKEKYANRPAFIDEMKQLNE